MKIILIAIVFAILPCNSFAVTENQCYFYASLLMTNDECLLDGGVSEDTVNKRKSAMDTLGSQCLSTYKDAWIAGLGIGPDELKREASCAEIAEEFKILIKKFGN